MHRKQLYEHLYDKRKCKIESKNESFHKTDLLWIASLVIKEGK